MTTALVFERDDVDEVENWMDGLPKLGRSSILWIDLETPTDDEIAALVDQLGLSDETAKALTDGRDGARFRDHGDYLHVTTYAPDRRDRKLVRGSCLVSKRWVVTVHDAPVAVIESFRERATGSGETGRLDGLAFLAELLEWVIASYLDAFEDIERTLEDIDERAMRGSVIARDEVIEQLVELRRETGRLRRALVSHRVPLLALTQPELERIASSDSAQRFDGLRHRLEDAVRAARDTTDSIVGSFDVLIASTGQRTNEIMKVLTLASVLLLPGALIAGILGMNFRVGFFEQASYFWVVVGLIVAMAVTTVVVARVRHWI